MPLQNRVDPWGVIHAVPARGTMMGNRGGKFHRPDRTLGGRRWATRHWICCDLHYKNAHHEAMGDGYTSLFFLDEVTALAAGHRPCFYCRRAEAKAFFALMPHPMKVDEADRTGHAQRLASSPLPIGGEEGAHRSLGRWEGEGRDLPDATMIAASGTAYAVRGSDLLPWAFTGYGAPIPRNALVTATLLTPPLYVGILAKGYQPRWHESALRGTE